jgi:hypothetical protein
MLEEFLPEPQSDLFCVESRVYKPLADDERTATFAIELGEYEYLHQLYVKGTTPYQIFTLLDDIGKELCNVDQEIAYRYLQLSLPPGKLDLYERMIGKQHPPEAGPDAICYSPLVIVNACPPPSPVTNYLPNGDVDISLPPGTYDAYVDKSTPYLQQWSQSCKRFTARVTIDNPATCQLYAKMIVREPGGDGQSLYAETK